MTLRILIMIMAFDSDEQCILDRSTREWLRMYRCAEASLWI